MNITALVRVTAVLALTLSSGCAQVPAVETAPQASAAAAPAAAGVPDRTAVLAQYVGQYNVNGATMNIRARGDRLVREMSGQMDQVLMPIGQSGTRFKVGTTTQELEFQPGESGRMTLILRAGQHEARGVRVRQR